MSAMDNFVMDFMKKRKTQKGPFADRRMLTAYAHMGRFNRLRNHLLKVFPKSGSMKKSEIFDFMIYLLEGFIKRDYGDYETFDEYWDEMIEKMKDE